MRLAWVLRAQGTTHAGTHRVLLGTHGVLTAYSRRTHGVQAALARAKAVQANYNALDLHRAAQRYIDVSTPEYSRVPRGTLENPRVPRSAALYRCEYGVANFSGVATWKPFASQYMTMTLELVEAAMHRIYQWRCNRCAVVNVAADGGGDAPGRDRRLARLRRRARRVLWPAGTLHLEYSAGCSRGTQGVLQGYSRGTLWVLYGYSPRSPAGRPQPLTLT